jgi:hypothetical protein
MDHEGDLSTRNTKQLEIKEILEEKDHQIVILKEELTSKQKTILELEKELIEMEERRRREEEERNRKPEPEPQRKWYIPLKGDIVDEMMAKYLNNCPHYVPVKRLGEGQYMYGSKKIFAKVMNGKLVIRVGGGYMLIDEFLANYAELEMEKEAGIKSPPKKRDGSPKGLMRKGSQSPKKISSTIEGSPQRMKTMK